MIQIGRLKKIILFGSYVRGNATRDSDLDVLVVAGDEVESPRRESIRLRNSVSDINMPMDILVVSYSRFEALREKLGLVYREADRYGKVVYESLMYGNRGRRRVTTPRRKRPDLRKARRGPAGDFAKPGCFSRGTSR